jgi:hypothetical protein
VEAEACGELHYEMETDKRSFASRQLLLIPLLFLFPYFLIFLESWFALLIVLSDG